MQFECDLLNVYPGFSVVQRVHQQALLQWRERIDILNLPFAGTNPSELSLPKLREVKISRYHRLRTPMTRKLEQGEQLPAELARGPVYRFTLVCPFAIQPLDAQAPARDDCNYIQKMGPGRVRRPFLTGAFRSRLEGRFVIWSKINLPKVIE